MYSFTCAPLPCSLASRGSAGASWFLFLPEAKTGSCSSTYNMSDGMKLVRRQEGNTYIFLFLKLRGWFAEGLKQKAANRCESILVLFIKMLTQCVAFNNSYLQTLAIYVNDMVQWVFPFVPQIHTRGQHSEPSFASFLSHISQRAVLTLSNDAPVAELPKRWRWSSPYPFQWHKSQPFTCQPPTVSFNHIIVFAYVLVRRCSAN